MRSASVVVLVAEVVLAALVGSTREVGLAVLLAIDANYEERMIIVGVGLRTRSLDCVGQEGIDRCQSWRRALLVREVAAFADLDRLSRS